MTATQHVRDHSTTRSAHPGTSGTFVFADGRVLSPTEVAALRIFAAAGIRPRCVLVGSDKAPDADVFRRALSADPALRTAADLNRLSCRGRGLGVA